MYLNKLLSKNVKTKKYKLELINWSLYGRYFETVILIILKKLKSHIAYISINTNCPV